VRICQAGRAANSLQLRTAQESGPGGYLRQTAHRGGKTVTVVTGFVGIGLPEKEKLAKAMQKACGTGGHGQARSDRDSRGPTHEVARILSEAGFPSGICWRVKITV